MLAALPKPASNRVLASSSTREDAALYLIDEDRVLVSTVDFFPPVVDDPYDYGWIAAVNAMSDIFAMGATPLFALSLLGFPRDSFDAEVVKAIITGAVDACRLAGIDIIGGHSIDDQEPKFGLAVTGIVSRGEIVYNRVNEPGLLIALTKPLGIGLITTAIKKTEVDASIQSKAIEVMKTSNYEASRIMKRLGVRSGTDVTGFGLFGHLKEMLVQNNLGAEVFLGSIPVLDGAKELARQGFVPGGTYRNISYVYDYSNIEELDEIEQVILCDPQTSGGLLFACDASHRDELEQLLPGVAIIGYTTEQPKIVVR